jgi:hypothetical protein
VASLQTGAAKWARKTANAGGKWKAGVSSGSTPCQGLTQEYPEASGCSIDAPWRQGVDAVSAADFQQRIAGKENKWLQNYLRGIRGGAG